MPKTILVTGANGLLGQKLVPLIASQEGFRVVATGRGANRVLNLPPDAVYEALDVCKQEQVDEVLERVKPDYVIHTAALSQVDECEKHPELCQVMNTDAVRFVAEACARLNIFMLHLSTDFIFDGEAGPYDEDAEANPLSIYGHSKVNAEKAVKAVPNLRWAIARTILVYGICNDMSRSNIILFVKEKLEAGKQVNIVDDQFRTPTLAEDLAWGCFLICKHNAEGIFNISGEEVLTPYDMALATADYFNLDKSLINRANSSSFTQPAKRPPRTGFIIDKAKRVLGFTPHSFTEGIAELAKQVTQQV